MAWTPLANTREEGWRDPLCDPIPTEEERTLGPPVQGLAPHEWMVLGRLFERRTQKEIAEEMRMSLPTLRKTLEKPEFKRAVEMVEASIMERVSRGEFGVLAIYKANAVGAARRIVGMSKASEDERIKFMANKEVIQGAGIKPPAPAVVDTPERIIDAMNADEAEKFAATGEFPERFRDQMARLATSVLEKNEAKRWDPKIEVLPLEGTDETEEAAREKAREEKPEDE